MSADAKRPLACKDCLHWKETAHSKSLTYEGHPRTGICGQLQYSNKLEIYVKAGWEGGYVDEVETSGTFFCADYKERT